MGSLMNGLFEMLADVPPILVIGWWFLVGSFTGSFLNVVVYRLPRNCLSVNNPRRSFCPSCKTQLRWNDNIPIVGWLLLRGKCRYCGFKFGPRYPAVELMVALLFAFAAWRALYSGGPVPEDAVPPVATWQAWLVLLHLIAMISVLVPWALIDADLTYIPHKLTFGPLIVFIPLAAFVPAQTFGLPEDFSPLIFGFGAVWLDSLLSALLTGVVGLAGLWVIGKCANVVFRERVKLIGGEAMGAADVGLMLLLGVMLGWPKLLAGFFVAILAGAIIGVYLLIRKQHGVPFGPYLAIGALSAALLTPWLFAAVSWYFSLLERAAG
jgi:leader peptidase (prepilin peptidase) / N-methyltransferase